MTIIPPEEIKWETFVKDFVKELRFLKNLDLSTVINRINYVAGINVDQFLHHQKDTKHLLNKVLVVDTFEELLKQVLK